jgi:undecaprenyl-diphosphatase
MMLDTVATKNIDRNSTPIRELIVIGGLLAPFLTLLLLALQWQPTPWDRRFAGVIQGLDWGAFAVLPRFGSELGGGLIGFYAAPAATALLFAVTRRWQWLFLLATLFVLHFVMISPKLFIPAARPSPAFGVEGAGGLHSFPSGHVQWAASFYGFLAYLVWSVAPARLRIAVLPAYALVVLGTMIGRIELGRHWPLDTVAGVLAGLIALVLVIVVHNRQRSPIAASIS